MTNQEAIEKLEGCKNAVMNGGDWREKKEALEMAVSALSWQEKCEEQYLDDIKNPLEPLKLTSALKSEIMKLELRKGNDPKAISVLDYTVIYALKECLDRRVEATKDD